MQNSIIRSLMLIVVLVASITAVSAQKGKKDKKSSEPVAPKNFALTNQIDSVSYGIGVNMSQSIKKEFPEANMAAIVAGMEEGVKGENVITIDMLQQIVASYFKEKQDKVNGDKLKDAKKTNEDGLAFLEANKSKEGVHVTASGLQYIIMKEGTGKQPTATSSVTVHYHGTTPDGTVFDSSVNRGEPATFGLNQVIKGWTEGVQLMKEGSKYKFFIPNELAYGSNPPPGGVIKAFMPLMFEVELIKVND